MKAFLRRWLWLPVALSAPLLWFPTSERAWVLLLVPLFLLSSWYAWGTLLPFTPLNPALFLLAFMLLVSLWAITDMVASLSKIAGLLLGLLVFFTTLRYARDRKGWMRALGVYALAGAGVAGLGIFGTQWYTSKATFLDRFTALLPLQFSGLPGAESGFQPNQVAGSLLWVAPLLGGAVLAFWTGRKGTFATRRWGMWAAGFALAGLFTLLVFGLAQSRGGYLGLLLAGILAAALALPGLWRWLGLGLYGAAGVLGVAGVAGFGWQGFASWLFGGAAASSQLLSTGTLGFRLVVWTRGLTALQDFGLTGMGMNRFRSVVHLLYPSFLLDPNFNLGHAHNEILQAGLDLGLAGMVAFLAINLGVAFLLFRLLRRADVEGDRSLRWMTLGLGAAWLGHFVYGITDAVALGSRPGVVFWMLLALIVSLEKIKTKALPQ